jgi:hypothetical protein
MTRFLAPLARLAGLAGLALCGSAAVVQASPASVIPSISAASGLPEAEIAALLADCAANQQAAYFCAWREQLQAERSLDAALAQRSQASPDCGKRLASEATHWKTQVQRRCRRSAEREWDGGSAQRRAELACTANRFDSAASAVATGTACRLPAPGR